MNTTSPELSQHHRKILERLKDGHVTATCHLIRVTGCLVGYPKVRRELNKLAEMGMVKGVKSSGGRILWWQITEKGKQAISGEQAA